MDAANPSATPTFASRTPLHVGAVGLIARDLDLLAGYYQYLLGLTALERTAKMAKLGVNGVTLLEIEHRPDARPDDQGTAGLYHTAFLMPTRQDHARWIQHIARNRVPISGASDHGVSEAFYLDDPEGNGVEVYNDRPKEQWQIQDGMVQPMVCRRTSLKYDDQEIATAMLPTAYSMIRSQPMIQATSSPRVA